MDIVDSRIEELKKAGYTIRTTKNRVFYSNGVREIPSTLIVGCGSKDWRKFIDDEKSK